MIVKRLMDIIIAFLAIVLLAPIIIVVSLLICIDSTGLPFYIQERLGKNGKRFNIIKFRTMVVNADQIGGYSTQPGDNRITRIGAFIRKTSIDELPQLFNVLIGDMSLVGPRPDVPAQESNYSVADLRKRLSVLPGATGLAQAIHRSDVTHNTRLKLDLEYVEKQSMLLDLKIFFLTLKQIFLKGGY